MYIIENHLKPLRVGRLLALWNVVILCAPLAADDLGALTDQQRGQLQFFEQKIRPVLVEHCYACHAASAPSLKGGLLLDSRQGWETGGESGTPAIVPGDPEASPLMQAVRYEPGLQMPPEAPLPPAVIGDLEAWIRDGAFDPRQAQQLELKRADKSWWSLQPLREFTNSTDSAAHVGSQVIDDLIDERLQQEGLERNPPADPRTLIRRMSYDLLGLPPTPAEVERFVSDYARDAQQAAEQLVDRLLASPHYGEQWGRHWLDVVRFGESNGFERNVIIDDLWPYRDYVIRSFNQDKPFNQFIIEQIAGDVVGAEQPEIEVGAAFLVAGPYDDVGNQDVAAQANIRAGTLDEIITATSGAFLGLTINCARCHHHKFDPIPTEDYYRLRAAFEGIKHGRRTLASAEQRAQHAAATHPLNQQKKQIATQMEAIEAEIRQRCQPVLESQVYTAPKIDPQWVTENFPATSARFVKLVMHASTTNPRSAVGARLVEVEVWSSGPQSRNVALASAGATASGPRSTTAEDFPEAYGPQFTIDGQTGEQWFIGAPAELLIELPELVQIERLAFSNAKGQSIQDKAQGPTPCEYEIFVSEDGQAWRLVADSWRRAPWSAEHGLQRLRNSIITEDEQRELAELRTRLQSVEQQLAAIPPLPMVFVGTHQQPALATRLNIGGDPMKLGAVVPAASLNVLDQTLPAYTLPEDASEGERRLALARWIADDRNPLTARVLANRVWQHHFGTGLVDTPSDFGYLGGTPSHPQLLDWLARRLIAGGWKLKPLHREILLSQTYRQASSHRPSAAGVDQAARLLWRFPPRRLAAEEIRDTFLCVTGNLQGYVGNSPDLAETAEEPATRLASGPGFRLYRFTQNNVCTYFPLDQHGPETYRRAVYHQNARASVIDLLSDFDLPDVAFAAPVRAKTTSPLQALTLLNHQFTLDMARSLSQLAQERLALEASSPANANSSARPNTSDGSNASAQASEPAALVVAMYQLLLQRAPAQEEIQAAVKFIEQHGSVPLARALLNLNEVLYVE